ncbi:putative ubiquinol-cytochrome c reductase complex subunit [Plasmodium gaboni]|uniref:Putative ubiquinol-cytochrome c reductase complex subunit n=1 Tax=Plasmodium gaboni TaxID=647221 RepID=A0A151LKJ3_9APIC|nr:putative ubiquinol-cytochrome c reductase complex subunit [Plasmodium gaboni]KYN99498.1 putative ubiquinol-cytochrome c reductase complex subunit [Plasmodium gaboni]SOV14729.1 ubiquinol-cytochrome c reductase complex subunit, putative [Plasmodium gaboni]SOV22847.1 ubiquinol-cytochrome c reductase complex subunit, putative [Plasmodium sp. DRC-Itaito]
MSLHKEICNYIVKFSSKPVQKLGYEPPKKKRSILRELYHKLIFPYYFKFIRAPYERWQFCATTKFLREHGLMYDDMYSDKDPVIERAISLLPKDIQTRRYRRMLRGTHINYLRLFLHPSEQNYDPYIPYLAPYIEEAKFQLQEEEELLGYHPYDRRLYSGGTTGFGDLEPGLHFLVSIPNLYGAAIPHTKKK